MLDFLKIRRSPLANFSTPFGRWSFDNPCYKSNLESQLKTSQRLQLSTLARRECGRAPSPRRMRGAGNFGLWPLSPLCNLSFG